MSVTTAEATFEPSRIFELRQIGDSYDDLVPGLQIRSQPLH